MSHSPTATAEFLLLLALMTVSAAVAALVTMHSPRDRRGLTLVLASLITGVVGAAALPTIQVWLPLCGMAIVLVAAWLVRSPVTRNIGSAVNCLRASPSAPWCGVLVAGMAAGAIAIPTIVDEHPPQDDATMRIEWFRASVCTAREVAATTDRGVPIRLGQPIPGQEADNVLAENAFMQQRRIGQRALGLRGSDLGSNCHGWVFTGGQYWIFTSEDVDQILSDNGYRQVSEPMLNDVVVYRERSGKIVHTALVCGFSRRGRVLVQSKWASFGVFVHPVDDQPYPAPITYYRSEREGHLLRGVPGSSPEHPLLGAE